MTQVLEDTGLTVARDYWYVLFVKTGFECRVVKEIEEHFTQNNIFPFIPLLEIFHKYACKIVKKETRPIFPGYVFIETELDANGFFELITEFVHNSKTIIRLLNYGNSNEIALRNEERTLLQKLYGDGQCINSSIGFMEGDRIYVTDGPLKGRESMIKRINRHRKEASIELEMLGRVIQVTVGLDIVEKILV